jgi:enoyl-CoA hydratase
MGDTAPLRASIEDQVLVVRLDDGKANALSYERLDQLHGALDRAEAEAAGVCFIGRPGVFTGGFDLRVMQESPQAAAGLAGAGGELLMRLYAHPQPTVAAVTGHAIAAGALLALACDTRFGPSDVDVKIGLNETLIGLPLPEYAYALARERLTPREFTRATVQARIYDAAGALAAGYLDELVPSSELERAAIADARRLGELPALAYSSTKRRVRQELADGVLARMKVDMGAFAERVSEVP